MSTTTTAKAWKPPYQRLHDVAVEMWALAEELDFDPTAAGGFRSEQGDNARRIRDLAEAIAEQAQEASRLATALL